MPRVLMPYITGNIKPAVMDVGAAVQEVLEVFKETDRLTALLKTNTGLECRQGCGRCCNNPDIDVYPVEFLPLALHLYNAGLTQHFLAQIALQQTTLCPLFKPSAAGACTAYEHRGLICRLMGYGAMRNKHGQRKLLACQVFKEDQHEKILLAEEYLNQTAAPYSAQMYDRLKYICPPLSHELLPIKDAIKTALEYVEALFYYSGEEVG